MARILKFKKPEPDDVHIYALGLCHCSVCADAGMGREVVESLVNKNNPTGIRSRWKMSDADRFADGHPNPCDCTEAAGRRHYLMVC